MSTEALALLLKAFRLPTMAQIYAGVVQQAEQQANGGRFSGSVRAEEAEHRPTLDFQR